MLRRSARLPIGALSIMIAGLASAGLSGAAHAQSPAPSGEAALTDEQRDGRAIFAQSCGVCHLSPVMNAPTYGPRLSQETAGGNADVIRIVIADGTPRMPGFKHYLGLPQINAIIAYLKTVPTPPQAAPTTAH
jgi:mono/diheme cytochrome c family protein